MKRSTHQKLAQRKHNILKRLDRKNHRDASGPMFSTANIKYELADKSRGMVCGGIGMIHQMVQRVGLAEAINTRVKLLKRHIPYFESDHVLTLAYNILCDGACIEDIERLRNDEVFLDALNVRTIPDPTTAGDFCRRFENESQLNALMDAINSVRVKVWQQQPAEFFEQAIIDADGTMAPTTGECKTGMDISYKGEWGYHPLLVSLANTKEPLYLLNRSGNRPSHERADEYLDKAVVLCRDAGFKKVLLRGDTDFTQTWKLDEWNAAGDVHFIFGADAIPKHVTLAEALPATAWKRLDRQPKYELKTQERTKPDNVKEEIVVRRKFRNQILQWEDYAEFEHQPTKCKQTYRVIALRKKIDVMEGEIKLFDEYRYFFYITNINADDENGAANQIIFSANDRCDQENLIAQLKDGGVRAMRNPLDNLYSNWAYMICASLAWTLKAWCALQIPVAPGRYADDHRQAKKKLLKMEFKTFAGAIMRVPAQIIRSGRRIIYRLLNWNPWTSTLMRLSEAMRKPMEC